MHHSVDGAEDGPGDGDRVLDGGEDVITDPEMESFEVDDRGFFGKDGRRAGVGVDAEGEQNPSDGQVLQAPVHSSPPRMVRRGYGRPRCSRTAITVQAEAWLAEEDLLALREAIAAYRAEQG
ncbi:MAG: hypothetical protein Q9228_007894, partial [Teloschistes exilis]